MIKYFCDKCGKDLTEYAEMEIFTVSVNPPKIRGPKEDEEACDYILCYDCTEKLNIFMHKKNDFAREAPRPNIETLHIPDACRACSNHPSNGGSGICNCTLGTPQVKC